MMHKLFAYIPGYNETNLNIKLSCYDKVTKADVAVTRSQQASPEDFKEAEETFKKQMSAYITSKNIEVKIELRGKLNGTDIKQEFTDLDSYQQFLENNNLINKIARLEN